MQFNYDTYAAQQAARKSGADGSKDFPTTQFINSFLKNDGDSVVVRFPYRSMSDVVFETTHSVKFPGDKWNKRVKCVGDNCPLCRQGVKADMRFFVKAIVYVVNEQTGEMQALPAVWDRAAAFADIDIKGKMKQCAEDDIGTLADNLVKIRKTGSGLDTRYTLDIVAPTNKVYNSHTCKADFSILENLDPTRIMTKTIDQYMAALNPDTTAEVTPISQPTQAPQYSGYTAQATTGPVEQPTYSQAAPQETPPWEAQTVRPAQPAQAAPAGEQRRPVRYSF